MSGERVGGPGGEDFKARTPEQLSEELHSEAGEAAGSEQGENGEPAKDRVMARVIKSVESSSEAYGLSTEIDIARRQLDRLPEETADERQKITDARQELPKNIAALERQREGVVAGDAALYEKLYDIDPDRYDPSDPESMMALLEAGGPLLRLGWKMRDIKRGSVLVEAVLARLADPQQTRIGNTPNVVRDGLSGIMDEGDVRRLHQSLASNDWRENRRELWQEELHDFYSRLEGMKSEVSDKMEAFMQEYASR